MHDAEFRSTCSAILLQIIRFAKIKAGNGCIWKICVPAMLSINTLFPNRISPPEKGEETKEKNMFLKQHEEANA
jgi:hypothetical protein